MQALTRIALIGTAQAPTEAGLTPQIDALLPAGSREQRLLWQAGAGAVYAHAGRLPLAGSCPEPAPVETLPEVPAALVSLLGSAIAGQTGPLAPWLAARMARQGYRIPHGLLPELFARPTTFAIWRDCLGERGPWLGRQHPQWQRLLPSPSAATLDEATLQRHWDEGDLTTRCEALRQWRRIDPASARDKLQAVLSKEKADPRQALVECLKTGLNAEDEPLLEQILNDRAQGVRQAAADLLAGLPESAWMQRMRERAQACVRWQAASAPQGFLAKAGALLGKIAQPVLTVEPPQELPKDWQRDGIVLDPPQGEGRRQFWLQQLLAAIPPAAWQRQSDANCVSLIAVMQASDWAAALLSGVAGAAVRHGDLEWAAALLEHELNQPGTLDHYLLRLWRVVEPQVRDSLLCRLLQAGRHDTATQCLQGLADTWSTVLVDTIVRTALADDTARRTVAELVLRRDIAVNVELAVLHAADDDMLRLEPLLTLYETWLSGNPVDQARISSQVRAFIALARAKQIVIKETLL